MILNTQQNLIIKKVKRNQFIIPAIYKKSKCRPCFFIVFSKENDLPGGRSFGIIYLV